MIEVCRRCHEAAAREFEKTVSLEPSNTNHWHALGLMYLRADCPVEALRAFDEALGINTDDLVALTYSHDALCTMGHFKEAQRRIGRALEFDPDNILAIKHIADDRSARGLVRGEEGKNTRQLIRQALRLAPDAPDSQESLARYHIFRGEWKKGIAVLQKFTEQHLSCPRGWYHYARWLFHAGESQTAADAIMKAYALYQNDAKIYQAACEILPSVGKLDDLQPLLEEMLRRFPEQWSVWTTAGLVLAEWFKDGERACTVASRGPQLQPHLADAWFQHGRVLALAGKHREAITALEEGWTWLPEGEGYAQSTPAAACLGESYRALGDERESRAWYEKSVRHALELIAINPAIAHYWQGKALERLGDVPRARQAYRTALRHHLLHPTRREVKESLKILQTRV
ncbi:MAG: tetratricopeptide repeat protein [Chloroflexi bacterium]|nr:tetratricopeptide repeat protein [Chloroflexota bacterium]